MSKNNKKSGVAASRFISATFSVLETIAPPLAKKLAVRLFFKPMRFKAPSKEQEAAKTASLKHYEFEGSQLPVHIWGKGKKVLLMHGWAGRGTQMGFVAQELANNGFQAIAFDAPGHGTDENDTHLLKFRDAVVKVNQEFGPFKLAVGHSLGCVAVFNAINAGVPIEKMVSISSPSSTERVIKDFCRLVGAGKVAAKGIAQHLQKHYVDDIEAFSGLRNVASVNAKGLVIHDEDDYEVPVDNGKEIHQAWEGSELHLTKGLGHRRPLKDKDVKAITVSFLKK